MLIAMQMGDWSGDGHEKTERLFIESNIDTDLLDAAYKAGVEIIGVDVRNNVCNDYEDNLISPEDLTKFMNHGLDLADLDYEGSMVEIDVQNALGPERVAYLREMYVQARTDESIYDKIWAENLRLWKNLYVTYENGLYTVSGSLMLTVDSFLYLFLFTASKGNPNFEYTILKTPEMNIGGYGLFGG